MASAARGISRIGFDSLVCALGCLDLHDVLQAGRVSKAWNNVAKSETLWKLQCQNAVAQSPEGSQTLAALSTYFNSVDKDFKFSEDARAFIHKYLKQASERFNFRAVLYGLETTILSSYSSANVEKSANLPAQFDRRTLTTIAEYAPDCMYKVKALLVTGELWLYEHAWEINPHKKDWPFHRFGRDEPEHFLCARASLSESLTFPSFLPFRVFINRDGSYKEAGDEVRLFWRGRKIILVCTHDATQLCHGTPIPTQRAGIEKRIAVGFNHAVITDRDIEQAKALAKVAPEWLNPA